MYSALQENKNVSNGNHDIERTHKKKIFYFLHFRLLIFLHPQTARNIVPYKIRPFEAALHDFPAR